MSNAFTNFLSGVVGGAFGDSANLKDYQHADRLYVRETYARAPKVGFLYFISFNINPAAVRDPVWLGKGRKFVGLLVKKLDLPKFSLETEVVNQYNRKTVIQKSIKYNPVNIEFHDDNGDITTNLWKNYYKYYYADSVYGDIGGGKLRKGTVPASFIDTKYGTIDYAYGLNNFQIAPFFESIDIYVLHQKNFTQYTLINPLVTEWNHDSLNQDEGGKVLSSKMNVAYENVIYSSGKIVKESNPEGFAAVYYDTSPSPLSIGGNGTNTLFGEGGVIAGASAIFGENGSLANAQSPLDYLKVAIQANTTAKNIRQLSKSGLKQEGYSILTGVLRDVQATGNQPGGVGPAIRTGTGVGTLGSVGINLFSDKNSSVNDQTKAKPSKLTGGG